MERILINAIKNEIKNLQNYQELAKEAKTAKEKWETKFRNSKSSKYKKQCIRAITICEMHLKHCEVQIQMLEQLMHNCNEDDYDLITECLIDQKSYSSIMKDFGYKNKSLITYHINASIRDALKNLNKKDVVDGY